MTTRVIPLEASDGQALAGLGWKVPAEPGWVLVGLAPGDGPVPGAIPCRLDIVPHVVWWAGPRDRFRGEKAAGPSASRWPTRWLTGYGPVTLGERTGLVGVLNVTPDSFSDGGRYLDPERAVRHALRLVGAGADWIDVGAESTRPGHTPVAPEEEWRRLAPVLERLVGRAGRGPRLMVDTRHPETARAAVRAGVGVLNDVSMLADRDWLTVLAESQAGYVLMFNRHEPWAEGEGDWAEALAAFREQLARLARLPGGLERVVLDPGLGFAWTGRDNLRVLARLALLRVFDRPVLVGPSRKRFVGAVTGRPVGRRDVGSAVAGALAAQRGADLVRLHNVVAGRDAARMADAVAAHA
ncbi:MAG: dihydropteroate synthase [Actinomycetia bacterium]|nr:dihydropteroate synthase [Actinomycetes bacterium]